MFFAFLILKHQSKRARTVIFTFREKKMNYENHFIQIIVKYVTRLNSNLFSQRNKKALKNKC